MNYAELHSGDEQNLVYMAQNYFGHHTSVKDCSNGGYWSLSGNSSGWYVSMDTNGQRIVYDSGGAPLVNLTSMTILCYIEGQPVPQYVQGAPMPHQVAPVPQSAHEVLMSNGYDTVEGELNLLRSDTQVLQQRLNGEVQMIKDQHHIEMANKDKDIKELKNIINNLVNPDKSLKFVTDKKFYI